MKNLISVLLLGLLLAGCATRGTLDAGCDNFTNYVVEAPESQLVRDIQADVGGPDKAAATVTDPLGASMQAAVNAAMVEAYPVAGRLPQTDVLLLSGGGQWGAYGVGFLDGLRQHSPGEYPRARVITGVSTGGLQALFLGAAADPARTEWAFGQLRRHYRPDDESEIVDRNKMWHAVFTGSVAGLKPLHRKILAALCENGDPTRRCELIEALAAADAPDVFIGFVDAQSGKLVYVPVNLLARLPDRSEAQQCIAGAALASAAMPVFFQQVTVGNKVYYDGGVRQSVFEAQVARKLDLAITAQKEKSNGKLAREPAMYVIRNGPTLLKPTEDKPGPDALSNALRAEAIVVNQLEVQSIADLRLAHPRGPIRLITADGWDRVPDPVCKKEPKDAMFIPDFMKCLTAFGEQRARRDPPWRELSEILPGAANLEVRASQ